MKFKNSITMKYCVLLLLSILLSLITSSQATPSPPTIHQILQMYNLPPGLFPDTITSYTLSESGSLSVSFSGQCYLGSGFELVYHPKVTGVIRNGSIQEIKGIESMYFHFWFWVRGIHINDYDYFDLGWITRMAPVSLFDSVPSCNRGPPVRFDPIARAAMAMAGAGGIA